MKYDEILSSPEEALHEAMWQMDAKALDEALNRSLSRVQTQINTRSIGIMSANLAANSQQQNLAARNGLTLAMKRAGFGYAHVRGVAQERGHAIPEPSLLLIGTEGDDPRLKRFLIHNGRKYSQDSVLYKSGASENATGIYTRDDPLTGHRDGQEEDWGEWHPNRSTAQFLTKLKGDRSFTFAKEGQIPNEARIVFTRPYSFATRHESLM
jgi:hypothetical protein